MQNRIFGKLVRNVPVAACAYFMYFGIVKASAFDSEKLSLQRLMNWYTKMQTLKISSCAFISSFCVAFCNSPVFCANHDHDSFSKRNQHGRASQIYVKILFCHMPQTVWK